MADPSFTAVKMYPKTSHDATYQELYPTGQPKLWAGKPRPVTQTYAKLCSTRGVPDMDAFSRLQFRENTGKICNGPKDIPTLLLTKGCLRGWLSAPLPPTPVISHTWQNCEDDVPFTAVHETGTNEFQPLLPANIGKIGRNPFSPPNGTVVTTSVVTPVLTTTGTDSMLMLLESTLLGAAAETSETGRRLVTYQMQMPTKDKETNNSKIRELSDTLETSMKARMIYSTF